MLIYSCHFENNNFINLQYLDKFIIIINFRLFLQYL